ncbi:uncharacterized protein [Hetaerina americana]|uniref:uncharacterized protein n=1 Tax=Hetaerina americana TaxID=62018 RepID=UPI003A7F6114
MATKSNTISMEQKMVLIRYMETHPDLSRGKLKAKSCHEDFMRMWKEVTHQLNSCRNGPKKNLVYWRQTWNDMKKTTRAKILQRRTGGVDGALVKLSPVQKRIAGLMCIFRSKCTVSTTTQDPLNATYYESQTCLDEGSPMSIPVNGNCGAVDMMPDPIIPIIPKVEPNNYTCVKSEPMVVDHNLSIGVEWNNSSETEGNESVQEQHPPPQVDLVKFFEYQKQSAEALSQLAESHRKVAEAALRTATAEERKASALEQLVGLLT